MVLHLKLEDFVGHYFVLLCTLVFALSEGNLLGC